MNSIYASWQAAFLKRFAEREDIGKEGLYLRYFKDLPEEEVFECLDLIEFEYEIPAGILRPEDLLTKLFEPVATKNPLKWLVYHVREGQSQTEIINELAERQRKHSTYGAWSHVETIDDLIRSWCGQKPK